MNLRIWIPCILLIVVIIVAIKTVITDREGFQVAATYIPPASLSAEQTKMNFWVILSKDKAGLPITSGSGSGSAAGSGITNLLELVMNPGAKDVFRSVYPKYLSMYALAKYNYNPAIARSALINQYDLLQNELQTAVETEQATRTLFANNPANASCNQLNTITMAFYGRLVSIYSKTQDLSGAGVMAESLHDENLALQGIVSNACTNQGPIPSADCIKLATRDETLFPLIPSFDDININILKSGQDIQDTIDILVQAYKGIGCRFLSPGSGSSGSKAPLSIDTVFSTEYIDSLETIDTYSLNQKLQELSPYYVSPNIINYISGKLIGTSEFNANLTDSLDYLADMNKVTNSIVSLNTDMMPIKAGQFYSESGATAGGFANCPPGYYCPVTASMPILCPVGTYCEAGTTDTPTDCPKGLFSPAGATDVSQCTKDWPPGYYVDQKTGKLVQCPTGSYCINGARIQCPPGTINRKKGQSTEASCLWCPAGSYCNSSVLSKPCPLGTYNALTKQSTLAACRKCPPGTYCSAQGMSSPTPCPAGQFSSIEGLKLKNCTNVEAGYYLPGTGNITDNDPGRGKIPCTVGHYCPAGSSAPVICTAGHYCDTTGLPAPKPCPGGTYGNTSGLSNEACSGECQAGYICPPGSTMSTVIPCPPGSFCPTGSAAAQTCPAGYYCGALSATGTACPEGTYNPDMGKISLLDACRPCPPEKFCGLGTSVPGPCPLGYYCPGGSQMYGSIEGTYCDETGLRAPKECPPGTYNPKINSISVTDCKPCDGGTYDTGTGQLSCRNTCPKGSFCASPKNMIAYAVPPTGASVYPNAVNGKINLPIGSTEPTPCPPGAYCNTSGMGTPTPCPPGTYSVTVGGDSLNSCIPCSPGKYCPGSGGSSQLPCPVGTYCPIQGGSSATQCPIANICPIPELQTPVPCPPGDLCDTLGIGSSVTSRCPAGTYSTGSAGSSCTPCPSGTYGLGASKTSACSGVCAAGYYCGEGTTTATPANQPCPLGHYCPPGTGTRCPTGKTFTNGSCS